MRTKARSSHDADRALYFSLPRQKTLDQLDRFDSDESLAKYIPLAWPILEPKRGYQHGWHIDAICDHLEALFDGEFNRLLINVPPGTMKSLTTNVFFPTWVWGPKNKPESRFISWSYSQDLTIRDNRRSRMLMQSDWYKRNWGYRWKFEGDQNAKTRYDNDKTGFRIATSIGGLATGERADYCIVDDPHNILEAESDAKRQEAVTWFTEVLPTRMNDPDKSAIIVIMQRVHEQDVAGTILEKELGYVHLCLPMEFEEDTRCRTLVRGFEDPRTEENELLAPERFPRHVVERDKKVLGEYAAAGQFQQTPAPRGGGMFKKVWWNFYQTDQPYRFKGACTRPARPAVKFEDFDLVVLSIDAAFKKNVKEMLKEQESNKGSRVGIGVIGFLDAFVYVLDDFTAMLSFTETVDSILAILGIGGRAQGAVAFRFPTSPVVGQCLPGHHHHFGGAEGERRCHRRYAVVHRTGHHRDRA